MAMQVITRGSLRDEIIDRLRALLVEGEVPPGGRLNESVLAAELGVSRTPLREALLLLAGEGLVECEPARGFVAASLSLAQARDTLPILAALEALALRSGGGEAVHKLDDLRRLHAGFETAPDIATARAIDERWHALLTSGCSNETLLERIEQLRRLERRLWLATVKAAARWPHPPSVFQHAAVMDAIDDGDVDAACAALERHWTSTTRELLSALTRAGH